MDEKMNEALEFLKYFKPPFSYCDMGQTIHATSNIHGHRQMCLQVRGWGHLIGGGANDLPVEEAKKVQDDFGQWVADTLNQTLTACAEVMGDKDNA